MGFVRWAAHEESGSLRIPLSTEMTARRCAGYSCCQNEQRRRVQSEAAGDGPEIASPRLRYNRTSPSHGRDVQPSSSWKLDAASTRTAWHTEAGRGLHQEDQRGDLPTLGSPRTQHRRADDGEAEAAWRWPLMLPTTYRDRSLMRSLQVHLRTVSDSRYACAGAAVTSELERLVAGPSGSAQPNAILPQRCGTLRRAVGALG